MSFPSHTILTGICSIDNLMNSIFTYLHMDPCEDPSCPIKLTCTARLQFSCPKNTEYSVMSLGVTCNAYRKCMCKLGSEIASSQSSNDKSLSEWITTFSHKLVQRYLQEKAYHPKLALWTSTLILWKYPKKVTAEKSHLELPWIWTSLLNFWQCHAYLCLKSLYKMVKM